MKDQTIEIPLKVGSRVSILSDITIDQDGGFTASTIFEDTVAQYNPDTNKLAFEESDVGYAEFLSMVDEHHSIQIIQE